MGKIASARLEWNGRKHSRTASATTPLADAYRRGCTVRALWRDDSSLWKGDGSPAVVAEYDHVHDVQLDEAT